MSENLNQSTQEEYTRGYIQGAAEMGHRLQGSITSMKNMLNDLNQAVNRMADEVSKLVNDSIEETKITEKVINHISCVICPIDNCPYEEGSHQCITAKREYFGGIKDAAI